MNNYIIKLGHLFMITLLALIPQGLKAQDNELIVGLRAGHNVTFGEFVATSLETNQTISEDFFINGGVQYSTIGRVAIEARPAYFKNFVWGRLAAEVLMAYTHLASINSSSVGIGACVDYQWINAKLGYYYRLYGGRGGRIAEPFNVYYELCAHLLQKNENWDMHLTITNNEIFELERHYQPSFIIGCSYYPMNRLGVSFDIGCKPAGMFNLSADYYQSHIGIGVCYKW